jgi:carbon storage regulator
MLIIRRRRGESITIGDEIEIEILETSPTQVKIGIRAPRTISVLRKEIHLTRQLNLAASEQLPAANQLTDLAEQLRKPDEDQAI